MSEHVTPDPADPGWAGVVHDTRTLDCLSDDHDGCFLPNHCRCPCHDPEPTP